MQKAAKIIRIILSSSIVATLSLAAPSVFAANEYGGGSVTGYAADSKIDDGTIVQLVSGDSKKVRAAEQKNLSNMFGVAVNQQALPISISSESLENQVFVAVSGTYNVLVSNQAGDISAGDYVTLSAINGVAMKAGYEEKTVFGRANGTFNGKSVSLGETTIKDTGGKDLQKVRLGSVPVTINIQRNPNIQSTKANLPEMLQRVGQQIAEKEVSPIRIYISIAVATLCLIAAIVVVYAGVRNSIISIGRNPMGKRSIFRALIEVILTSVLILVIGLFAVYLLLKL